MTHQGRTALYRFFDADDVLLYVGIAYIPDSRQGQHARDAADTWYPLQVRRTLVWFDTRNEAEQAEKAAIKTERPRFNARHNLHADHSVHAAVAVRARKRTKIDAVGGAGQAPQAGGLNVYLRNQIDSGALPVGTALPKQAHLKEQFGVTGAAVQRALLDLVTDGYVIERRAKGYIVLPAEDRTAHIPVGRAEEAAAILRESMTANQLADLLAALQLQLSDAA